MRLGQQVAACVPYTKRREEWIIARIESYDVIKDCYVVKDSYPEKRKKVLYENVPLDRVIRFPPDEKENFIVGEKVLSLWLINEDKDEWSTMFYEATVAEPCKVGEKTAALIFKQDPAVYQVDKTKVVKFKQSTRISLSNSREIEALNGNGIQTSPLKKTEQFENGQVEHSPKKPRFLFNDLLQEASIKEENTIPESKNKETQPICKNETVLTNQFQEPVVPETTCPLPSNHGLNGYSGLGVLEKKRRYMQMMMSARSSLTT